MCFFFPFNDNDTLLEEGRIYIQIGQPLINPCSTDCKSNEGIIMAHHSSYKLKKKGDFQAKFQHKKAVRYLASPQVVVLTWSRFLRCPGISIMKKQHQGKWTAPCCRARGHRCRLNVPECRGSSAVPAQDTSASEGICVTRRALWDSPASPLAACLSRTLSQTATSRSHALPPPPRLLICFK